MFRWFLGLFRRKRRTPGKYKLTRAMLNKHEEWLEKVDHDILQLESDVMGDPVSRKEIEDAKDFEYGPLGSEC